MKLVLGLLVAVLCAAGKIGAAEFHELRSEPTAVKQGELIEFRLSAEGLMAVDRTFAVSRPEKLWEFPFVLPVEGIITSPFGYRRVINGIPRAPHTGVDLRAAIGTPVLAANQGRVALTGDFFFSGKTLVL